MNTIIEFFKGLFDTTSWPPRWHCGYWTDFHGWLYITSDLMIWFAYFMIPVIIYNYFSKRKHDIKYPGIYILFAAFILLCGTTHLLDACMFWVPMYRLNALIRFITGIVSLFTVYYLIKILPEAFRQKTKIELEREIGRREQTEYRLSDANKSLEAFASIASHDLQEPLRKIRTYSTMLYEANADRFSSESKELARKIIQSTNRMHTLIQDVLSLSTISEETVFQRVHMNEVLSHVLDDLEIKIREKNAQITIGALPDVNGNESYLNQLFLNLISNAIKFTHQQPEIQVNGETIGARVFIRVSDNGIGIAEKDKSKIFEAFYRLNGKSEFEGSGIGLTICKKIVAIHQGNIEVQSRDGQGTTFTIELPAAE